MRRFFMLTLLALAGFGPPALAAPAPGKPAPALVVPELDGTVFDLSAMKGKVVIVNFWATWCPPCQAELPELRSFYTHYHKRGVEVIGVSADRARDRGNVKMLMQEYFYPAAMLADAQDNGFGDPESLPLTYVIDTKGIIRAVAREPVTRSDLARVVEPLLNAAPASGAAKGL